MNKKRLISILLILASGCFAITQHFSKTAMASNYPNFHDNPRITNKMQTLMAPYLLPVDHPIKEKLDLLFSGSRVIHDEKTLTAAGFTIIFSMPVSFVTVARHPDIPGFVFKLYLDIEKRTRNNRPHWEWLTKRCNGAEKIRTIIQEKKIRHFTVPDKWLYILSSEPAPENPEALPIILVETDMQLESIETTELAWKTCVTPEHLDELYAILKKGYGTIALVKNVPYTQQKTFAFTDTEYPERAHKLKKLKSYLSEDMQKYWNCLIQ